MSAIQQIVDAYVRLGDRQSLEDLLAHRQRAVADMKGRDDFDFSVPMGQISDDLTVVLHGLEKLRLHGEGASEAGGAGHPEPSE